jgi:hypothetical protein
MMNRERIEISEVSDNIGAFLVALGLKLRTKYTCSGTKWSLSNGVVVEMFKINPDSLSSKTPLPPCVDWLVQIYGITRSDETEHVVNELQKFASMLAPFFVGLVDDGKGNGVFPKEQQWKAGENQSEAGAPQYKRQRTGETWR